MTPAEIAENIFNEAETHFRQTDDLNFFSQSYPNDHIPSIIKHMASLTHGKMECLSLIDPPCFLNPLMCFWPPPDHGRIVCHRCDNKTPDDLQKLILNQ